MSPARLPVRLEGELLTLTPDIPDAIFGAAFRDTCERLDAYIGALAAELARQLAIGPGPVPGVRELLAANDWSEQGEVALTWLLETLELYGWAETATGGGWTVDAPVPDPSSAQLRARAVAAVPAAEPAYRVLELCAEALPAVLAGTLRGEEALFGPATLGLWFDYFSNENPHYGQNNAVAALAAERSVSGGARVMEVGGGGGSAALALLERLSAAGKEPARYLFTEIHPAFLRRGTRALQGRMPTGCELEARRFDLALDPGEQGVEAASFDLVFAVNVLHLASDLVLALSRLRSLLAPGGVLVLGELMRPSPTAPVHLELPFGLLEAYRQVPVDDGFRRRPGFLAAESWQHALERAGFSHVSLLPAAMRRCAELYPGFYCGAITAKP